MSIKFEKFAATRDGFGKGLLSAGQENHNIVSCEADLGKSTRSNWFRKEFPNRSFNFGISETDMVLAAAGLASCGKIAFASTFAIFTERAFEPIRNVIARMNCNVKIIGSHAGVHTGEDGSSAQCIEDLAIYRTLPNFTVLCPADSIEAEQATHALVKHEGPAYMRLTRNKIPVLFDQEHTFKLGKGTVVRDGKDVTIIACGPQVAEAMHAAESLKRNKVDVRVVNMPSIKPLDARLVVRCAKETSAIVTAEDHSVIGGLGGAVCEVLSEQYPTRVERVGMRDVFGESGDATALYKKYGLDARGIVEAVKLTKTKKR